MPSLIAAFPLPEGPELRKAYRDLFLAENGDEETKKRIGNPMLLPRPWDPPTCNKPALRVELWGWLEDVVAWFNREYVWDHTIGMIPACWPQHPDLVHEIAVLADQRRLAALATTSSNLDEWHHYTVPAFLDHLRARTKNGCDERHVAWPAAARHRRYLEAGRDRQALFAADVDELQTRILPSTPSGRPRLRLLDGATGEQVDPVTGEIY